jgi:hypothetical protein
LHRIEVEVPLVRRLSLRIYAALQEAAWQVIQLIGGRFGELALVIKPQALCDGLRSCPLCRRIRQQAAVRLPFVAAT